MGYSFRTSPSPTYIPPTRDEMRKAADDIGLKSFSPSLVEDLVNLASGGKVNPPSSYRRSVQEKVQGEIQEDTDGRYRHNGHFLSYENGYDIYNRSDAVKAATDRVMRYHQNVVDFCESLSIDKFEGDTPLQKAMAALKLLSKQNGGGGGDADGDMLPIFSENSEKSPEQTAKKLNDIMDTVDSLDCNEETLLDPNAKWADDNNDLNRQKVAEDIADSDIKELLDVSRQLDKFSKMKVHKTKKVIVDPAGELFRKRQIKDISEIGKLGQSAWGDYQANRSLFWYKTITKQYQIKEKITKEDRIQILMILCDCSGSMEGSRFTKASGIVLNRLKAAADETAEVHVALFDDKMREPMSANDWQSAQKVMTNFRNKNFSGGGTNIATALSQAVEFINKQMAEKKFLYKPEIVIITDDDSSSGQLRAEGVKVHGFAVETKNKKLIEFCRKTGGIGIEEF